MSKILATTASHDARSKRSEVLGPKTATPALPFFIFQKNKLLEKSGKSYLSDRADIFWPNKTIFWPAA